MLSVVKRPGFQLPWLPSISQKIEFDAGVALQRGDRVLHEQLGLCQVLDLSPSSDHFVTVEAAAGTRKVSTRSLRPVVTRTRLTEMIENTHPEISAWTVRKADEGGWIRPDATGRIAGHTVHYYDVARVPALISQLAEPNRWPAGTLVTHSEYGAGRVLPGRAGSSNIAVAFFAPQFPVVARTRELRELLSNRAIASRLGVDRKSFTKLAGCKGIHPDYRATNGRAYFDEGRIEEVRAQWFTPQLPSKFPPGSMVLDGDSEVASVKFQDGTGRVHLRYPGRAELLPADTANLRRLVSMRELARTEMMSRYKIARLLGTARVKPLYRTGNTTYFDLREAREAVKGRLGQENSAVSLDFLSGRTGVSAAVLARKVHHGCVRTLGGAAHCVEPREAVRVERLVEVLRSGSESLPSLKICRLHPRGRIGQEVAEWDIWKLVQVAGTLGPKQRAVLFDQVAWLCDGAGEKRLREALDSYFLSGGETKQPGASDILLSLSLHLPKRMFSCRNRLTLLASGATQSYKRIEAKLLTIAEEWGLNRKGSFERLRRQVHGAVAELLYQVDQDTLSVIGDRPSDDGFAKGAIVVSLADRKPEAGLVVKVERQTWNTIQGRWNKIIVVRFASGERRVNPYTRHTDLLPLLRPAETAVIFATMDKPRLAA